MDKMFTGKNGFIYFFGTVESDGDPKHLGRVRVRCEGYHNKNYNILKSEQLPWAYPVLSYNDWNIAGVGTGIKPPPPGARVFGFFLDGELAQKPVVLGVVTGNSEQERQRAQEYSSRPWFPNFSNLLQFSENEKGDIPSSAQSDNTTRTLYNAPSFDLSRIDPGEWVLPYSGYVSSPYGELRGNSIHRGVDICPAGFYQQSDTGASHLGGLMRGPTGRPVYAAADGEVVWTQFSDKGQSQIFSDYDITGPNGGSARRRSFGNVIAIQHNLSSGSFVTIYAHLGVSQDPAQDAPGSGISVSVGQKVSKGQQIGSVGRSHNWSTATHLHFEIREGTGLPAAPNTVNPGDIFPQLRSKHTAIDTWVDSAKYTQESPYKVSDMPVVAGEGPA